MPNATCSCGKVLGHLGWRECRARFLAQHDDRPTSPSDAENFHALDDATQAARRALHDIPIAWGAARGDASQVNQDVLYLYGANRDLIAVADVTLVQRAIDRHSQEEAPR